MIVPPVTQTDPLTQGNGHSTVYTKGTIQGIIPGSPTDIVLENVPKPAMKTDLPRSQQRIARTNQLVYCNTLLLSNSLDAQAAEPTINKAEFEWLKEMQKDPMEAERLRLLVTQMVEAFLADVADAIKESTKVADVVTLGPVLLKEPFRKLLTSIIGAFNDARILDVDLLQGLVQLLQSASPGYLVSDDLVKILSILRVRLEGTHQQSTEHCYHLSLAVSRVLDVMADHKVQDLDRVLEHEPLSAVLYGLKGSSDPYLMYQACYAFQALQYVRDDETALQAMVRHSARLAGGLIKTTAIFKLDLASILEDLGSLQKSIGSAVGVGSTVYEGVSSLMASGQNILDSLKEEFGSGQKRPWYVALKAAYAFTLAGQLNDLQRLIYEAPCRCDPLFQWGICQLLGEIAIDPAWTSSTRQQTVYLLGHLYQHDQDWGWDESVRLWMLTIITKLRASSGQAVSTTTHTTLKNLEHDKITLIQHTYPLSARLPLSVTSPLLAKVYNTPDVEYDIHKFRLQRLEESKLRVYIPPMAKASLQARDDDLFPLMDNVQEFLASDKQVMLILGDSGSGKSTFNTHLEHKLLSTYTRGSPIPLFINLPAIDQPDYDMIEKQLATDNFSNDQILELKHYHQFILICDGYDESQQQVNLHRTNMLNQPGQWKTKMVITCRTQYLGQDYRSRFMPQSSDYYAGPRPDLYQEAVIAPFSKDQIEEYVGQYVPLEPRTWTTEDYIHRLTTIPNLLDLVRNPFLLTLALAALPGVTEGKQDLSTIKITRVQLYDTFVDHWISVNKRRLEGMTLSVEDRVILDQLLDVGFVIMGTDYSTRLASAIFEKQNGNPVVQYVHLKDKNTWRAEFFGQNSEARLLRESSPLARTGRLFRFLHRSILEYFFSRAVFDPSSVVYNESEIVPQSVSGSSSSFSSVSALLDTDCPLFKRNLLTEPSVIQFLSERVMQHPDFEKQLLAVVEQSKTDATAAVAAANSITILVRAGIRFNGADLRGIRVPGADLSNGQFDCAQFQKADLRNVNLTWSWLRQAILSGAHMEDVRFGELPRVAMHSNVYACAFSPDGNMLVLGEYNDCVEVLDTTTWTSKHLLVGHEEKILSVAVSPDSRRIVSASQDGNLRLWDSVNGGEALLVLEGHGSWVNSVRFSPCGKRIASGSHDNTVRVWDAETGESLLVLEGHSKYVWCIAYSPNGRQLVSGDDEGVVRFWDAGTAAPGVVWDTEMGKIFRIAWSPNGYHIVFASTYDSNAHLWNAFTGERLFVLSGHTRSVLDLAFSPSGEHLVTASDDNSLRVWDASTGHLVSTLTGHDGSVNACAFSPNSQRIASGGGYELRLWDVILSEPGFERYDHSDLIEGVLYTPDGQSLFTRGDKGVLRQWDVLTGMPGHIRIDVGLALYAMAISPDGALLALGGSKVLGQNCFYLLSRQTGEVIRDFQEHPKIVMELAFSPCGRWLASIGYDRSLRLWDLQDVDSPPHTLIKTERTDLNFPTGMLFSPSGHHLSVGFCEGNVSRYNTQTWSLLNTIRIDISSHGGMSYSPDGRHLAVSTSSNSIYLWDLKSDTPNIELSGHDNFPRSVAYSPCGQWILSGGDDKTVRLWQRQKQQSESEDDVGCWSCVYVLQGFMSKVSSVAWNPLGSLEFATGCLDSSVRIWRIADSVAGNGDDDVKDNGESRRVHVGLVWGTDLGQLVALDAELSGVVGLDATNFKLLVQRGALDGSLNSIG